MASRTWVLGDAKEGYSVTKINAKLEPWVSQVWLDGKIARTDRHATKADAIAYCYGRYKRHRGYGSQGGGLKIRTSMKKSSQYLGN